MDVMKIRNLRVFAHHGVYERETKNGQNFVINAVIYGDNKAAADTDDLQYAVDYGKVCHFMHAYFQSHTYKLIETAADRLAEEVLLSFPVIHRLELEIRKPEAPIGLPMDYVSVTTEKGWHQVYISVGSNIGDKNQNIENGIQALNVSRGCRVTRVSSIFKTKPYGEIEQDDFLNGAFLLETILSPMDLLKKLKEIEERAGKGHTVRWGPRALDLDILFYDDIVYDSKELTIPHPDMENRDFVLVPMSELADYYRHPLKQLTVRQMVEQLKAKTPGYILE